jgi:hypothetical protein
MPGSRREPDGGTTDDTDESVPWGPLGPGSDPIGAVRAVAATGVSEGPTAAAALALERLGTLGVAVAAAVLTVGATLKEVLEPGRVQLSADSALYQHGGWYMTVGGVPYVDMFDVKPPVAFEIPALLAVVSGGNPTVLYALSVLVTGGAAVGIAVLVDRLTVDLTGDEIAGTFAGVVILAYPLFFYYAAKGFRPKVIVLLFGLGGIYAAVRGRGAVAGALAAAAAGTWQLAVFFPAVVLVCLARGRAGDRTWSRRPAVRNALAAMAAVTALAVAPVVLQGGTTAMLLEAVIIPLQDAEGQTVSFAATKATFLLGFATLPVVAGALGAARFGVDRLRGRLDDLGERGRAVLAAAPVDGWWLPLAVGFFTVQVWLDLDYYPDLFPIVTFAAIGVGVLAAGARRDVQTAVGVALAAVVVLNAALALGIGPFAGYTPLGAAKQAAESPLVDRGTEEAIPAKYGPYYDVSNGEFMNDLYWNTRVPEYCHYRFAGSEMRWLQRTDRTYRDPCGVPPEGSILTRLP